MALKCADLGHLAASPEVHKRWAHLLEEEFFLQVSETASPCVAMHNTLVDLHDITYKVPATCTGGPGEAAWDDCQSPHGQEEQGRHHTFSGQKDSVVQKEPHTCSHCTAAKRMTSPRGGLVFGFMKSASEAMQLLGIVAQGGSDTACGAAWR